MIIRKLLDSGRDLNSDMALISSDLVLKPFTAHIGLTTSVVMYYHPVSIPRLTRLTGISASRIELSSQGLASNVAWFFFQDRSGNMQDRKSWLIS